MEVVSTCNRAHSFVGNLFTADRAFQPKFRGGFFDRGRDLFIHLMLIISFVEVLRINGQFVKVFIKRNK